jgi:hypothetical protein
MIIELEGVATNKSAIGSRIEIKVSDQLTVNHTVGTGGSFGSSSLQAEIGLGQARVIEELLIHWQSGTVQQFFKVDVNTKYRITEGGTLVPGADFTPVPWTKNEGGQHHHD